MFKVDGDTVSVNQQFKLKPKQVIKLRNLKTKDEKWAYLFSLTGRKSHVRHQKAIPEYITDRLAEKRPNSVAHKFSSLLYNDASMNHTPLYKSSKSMWVGVEIECMIDGAGSNDSCYDCDGSGELWCHNCEGSGTVSLEDDNGNTYTNDCIECDGNGSRECYECDGSGCSGSSGTRQDLMSAIRKAGITLASVRSDGSLDDDDGVEICMLFDAAKGFKKLEKLCKVLDDFGATVNKDCGLHVHLDFSDKNETVLKHIAAHFEKFLPMLLAFVPESRRMNEFCRPQVTDQKYSAVNLAPHRRFGTVEVRLHTGSVSFKKIKNWIMLLNLIKKRWNQGTTVPKINNFQNLIDTLPMNEKMIEYFDRRLQKFNSDSNAINIDELLEEIRQAS